MKTRKSTVHRKWVPYGGAVLILHIVGLTFLALGAQNHPLLLGMALLSYTFGLRHAFDVDHIAAIDNTVRKLLQKDKEPVGVGFFFSLGHSTVVFIMIVLLAFSIHWAEHEMPRFQEIGSLIGTVVSGLFLLIIGLLNAFVLLDLQKAFLKIRQGVGYEQELDSLLDNRGLITRLIGPLLQLVTKSWHVYPIGFLFGLGFDTASEVALLAISAGAAKHALSIFGILSLPILFSAGMSLMDTADGFFMVHAYNWAFRTPLRKIYYNLTVTSLSVLAALFIGFIELVQSFSKWRHLDQGFWKWMNALNMNGLGFVLVGLFLVTWVISFLLWKGLKLEERWGKSSEN